MKTVRRKINCKAYLTLLFMPRESLHRIDDIDDALPSSHNAVAVLEDHNLGTARAAVILRSHGITVCTRIENGKDISALK